MKKVCAVWTSVLCLFFNVSFTQSLPKSILPYPINISTDKTSNLIFPVSIKSVDRGSASVLAQKASGVENVLQIKAGEENFKKTNLTVITDDGHFYSFTVSYAAEPAILNFSFKEDSNKAIISNQSLIQSSFSRLSNEIRSKQAWIRKNNWEQNVGLFLTKLFMKDGFLWLELKIENNSLIPFTPAYTRFMLRDTKTARRTATQETELLPLMNDSVVNIPEHVSNSSVFVFNPFTIWDSKELIIQVGESEGSRLLTLPINHRIMNKIKAWKK